MEVLGTIFTFIGGLGMFLYGMNTMADGLQKTAGNKMKKLLAVLTNNRLLAVVVGVVITAIIQSSSATTVMIVGFVNAGLMNLSQAVGVIMGANIGTTVTAWIVSMSEWGAVFKPEFFAPLLVGIGVFLVMFTKKEKVKEIAQILIGFSLLFIGLSFMSGAIAPYRESPVFSNMFRVLGANPFLGILAGLVVTAIIQSSSASVGILQTLAANGIVSWKSAIFVTLGQNIGTCVTALMSSAGAHKVAKRAAIIHLMFNVFGAALFGVIMYVLFELNPVWASSKISIVQISIFHTIFNVSCTIVLFPFANKLVHLSERILKVNPEEQEKEDVVESMRTKLDPRILESPSFAIQTAIKEVVEMANITRENFNLAIHALLENDETAVQNVLDTERQINQLEKVLTDYLVSVDNLSLTEDHHVLIKNLLYTVHDIERIGDHSENLAELAMDKIRHKIWFSDTGYEDMKVIVMTVSEGFEAAIKARETSDLAAVRMVVRSEDEVDTLEDDLREKHMFRLSNGECKTESGIVFLDTLSNLERISDHCMNIAGYVQLEV